MNERDRPLSRAPAACARCARRSALLERMSAVLNLRARDASRFWHTLSLPDEQLIAALGGRRRQQLESWHATLPDPRAQPLPAGVQRICRHHPAYPRALTESPLAPHELHLLGGIDRLQQMLAQPVVAVVGTRRCSDYGMEVARGLGHELARAGVSVIAELTDGIALWAHTGALEAKRSGIGVMAGGVETCTPACARPVYRGLAAAGCLLAELGCGCTERRWAALARTRTLALLAQLVIVVEAGEQPRELACALLARQLAKKLGAVPGRVGSHPSQGTNWLIRQGACLIRGAHDALEALYEMPAGEMPAGGMPAEEMFAEEILAGDTSLEEIQVAEMPASEIASEEISIEQMLTTESGEGAAEREPELPPQLERVLGLIGEGKDTVAKLSRGPDEIDATLAVLAELELRGLVFRGDGGRYVRCAVTR